MAHIKGIPLSEEHKKRISEAKKRYGSFTKEHCSNISKGRKGVIPVISEESMKNRKIKLSNALRGRTFSQDFKNKVSSTIKKLWQDPEYRAMQIEKRADKQYRKSMSEKTTERWKDSDYRERTIKSTMQASHLLPNKYEIKVHEMLEQMFPGKFVYVGDGSLVIDRRVPDFLSKELNVVVEANSLYWHLLHKGKESDEKSKRMCEKKEALHFFNRGYEVWFIWDDNPKEIIKYASNGVQTK